MHNFLIIFPNNIEFPSLKTLMTVANIVDCDEMIHPSAFYLGHHCF